MNDTSFSNFTTQNISWLLLPLALLFISENTNILSLDFKDDINLQNKIDTLQKITPYFNTEQQKILSKVQDMLDITSRVTNLKESNYNLNMNNSISEIPITERYEKILEGLSEHANEKNKELLNKILETKRNIEKTQTNFANYSKNISTQDTKIIDSIIELSHCFTPILPNNLKNDIAKIESMFNIIQTLGSEG